MPRLIWILNLLIIVNSYGIHRKINNQDQDISNKVEIKLELRHCVNINKQDTITFVVSNGNGFGFWIHSWNLFIDSITTRNGVLVSSTSLVEYKHPNIAEYFWIEANSIVRISYPTDFFLRVYLKKAERYYIYTSYGNYAKVKKKIKRSYFNEINQYKQSRFLDMPLTSFFLKLIPSI